MYLAAVCLKPINDFLAVHCDRHQTMSGSQARTSREQSMKKKIEKKWGHWKQKQNMIYMVWAGSETDVQMRVSNLEMR